MGGHACVVQVADVCDFPAQRTVMAPKEEAAAERTPSGARLEVMRLTREEMAFQPVPLLPNLPRLSAAALAAAPRLRQSGPFSAFTVPPSVADQQWVVRPVCTPRHPASRMSFHGHPP